MSHHQRRYQTIRQHFTHGQQTYTSPPPPTLQPSNSSIPALADFRYHLPSSTRFHDCDIYGHVNNVIYYSYFDTLVNTYLRVHGGMAVDSDVIGVVVTSSCTYVKSLTFPSEMVWGLRIHKIGRTSCTYKIGVFAKADTQATASTSQPILCAYGDFTHVFVERGTMKPTMIPAKIRAALEAITIKSPSSMVSNPTTSPSSSSPSFSSSPSPSPPPSPSTPTTARHVLMVRPTHFTRNEETAEDNAFMLTTKLSQAEIQKRTNQEFNAYVDLLRRHDVRVTVHDPSPYTVTPDSVYPNNWFSTHPRLSVRNNKDGRTVDLPSRLILYPMRAYSRRLERDPALVQSLRSQYDTCIDLTSSEMSGRIFEGTGSAIIDHRERVLYYCYSERSHADVAAKVGEAIWSRSMDYRVVGFEAVTSKGTPHYHTNVMMALGTNWCVICTECMPRSNEVSEVLTLLRSSGRTVIEITPQQVESFCANILELENQAGDKLIVMSQRAHDAFTPTQRTALLKHVKKLLFTPLTTIEDIGGGGARCMIAELF